MKEVQLEREARDLREQARENKSSLDVVSRNLDDLRKEMDLKLEARRNPANSPHNPLTSYLPSEDIGA